MAFARSLRRLLARPRASYAKVFAARGRQCVLIERLGLLTLWLRGLHHLLLAHLFQLRQPFAPTLDGFLLASLSHVYVLMSSILNVFSCVEGDSGAIAGKLTLEVTILMLRSLRKKQKEGNSQVLIASIHFADSRL